MAASATSVTLRLRVAWWLWVYFDLLAIAYLLTGREPDWEKLNLVVQRAIRMEAA